MAQLTPSLTVLRDGVVQTVYPLEGEVLLGRSEDCKIRIRDQSISRVHALFRIVGGQIQVEKKSEFGSLMVNGADCTKAILKVGDSVLAGKFLIQLSIPEGIQSENAQPQGDLASPPVSSQPDSQDLQGPQDLQGLPDLGGLEEPQEPQDLQDPLNHPDLNIEGGEIDGFGNGGGDLAPAFEEGFEDDGKTKVGPASKLSVHLVLRSGEANVTDYEINQDEIVLGRGKNCDIVLNDKKASRKNAVIRRAGIHFVIKDLDSSNGTYVNGTKIQEHELTGDDVIRIGGVEFEFKALSADYLKSEKDLESLPMEGGDLPLDFNEVAPPLGGELMPANGMDPAVQADPGLQNPMVQNPLENVIGISLPGAKPKRGTLIEKFRALPKRTQMIIVVFLILFLWWLNEDDEPVKKKGPLKGKTQQTAGKDKVGAPKGLATFETLTAEQKQFVEAQHALAFEAFKQKDYDKALFEIRKIFDYLPDYKDSKDIERYALEGKRKKEALEEEARKKDEEARLKAKITQLLDQAKTKMDRKEYEAAKEIFVQILTIDPDNTAVSGWRKEIDAFEEEMRLKVQQKQVEVEINKRAWDAVKEGIQEKKNGKYHAAIRLFEKIKDIGASDRKLGPAIDAQIAECRRKIKSLRDPVLRQAKTIEESGELPKAFELYRKATQIDPYHPAGFAGMNRIRGVLHERAKVIYTEAILAESYSDFDAARKKFEECREVAPKEDLYHERAARKLSHYPQKKEETHQ